METTYEFRMLGEWPVYEQVRYVEESPPVAFPPTPQTPPANGVLVHEGKLPSIRERRLLRGERLDLHLRYIRECPRLAPSPRAQAPPPGGALVHGAETRRMYDPLVDKPELWCYFANLDPRNEKQMVNFARRYGLLGLDRFGEKFATPFRGEYVEHWNREIITMKAVNDVYRKLDEGDRTWLASKFRRHPRSSDGVLYLYDEANSPSGYYKSELVRMGWGWEGLGDWNQPLETGRKFIADLIQRRLYGRITPMVDTSQKKPMAVLNIPSLLDAMYMQVWLALASGEIGRMKRCPSCGRWFRPRRKDHRWCDDYCGARERMRRYRKRKAASSQSSSP